MATRGHYELETLLCRGGMGEVWLARDMGAAEPQGYEAEHPIARRVALKIPKFDLDLPREDILHRFAREARTLARLDHPGIPKLIDAMTDGDEPYLAMEYIEGQPLHTIVEHARLAGVPLPESWIASVARQLAAILAYVHGEADLIHRDVKPSNVIVTEGGHVVLVDFGIALAPGETRLTGPQIRLGSPRFMAPEQHETPPRVSYPVDVYAFGLVLFELLTGRLPEGSKDRPNLRRDLQAIRRARPNADRAWDELLRRCLEPDPERRIADGRALVAATAWMERLSVESAASQIAAAPVGEASADAAQKERIAARPWTRRAVNIGCIAAIAGALLFVWLRRSEIMELPRRIGSDLASRRIAAYMGTNLPADRLTVSPPAEEPAGSLIDSIPPPGAVATSDSSATASLIPSPYATTTLTLAQAILGPMRTSIEAAGRARLAHPEVYNLEDFTSATLAASLEACRALARSMSDAEGHIWRVEDLLGRVTMIDRPIVDREGWVTVRVRLHSLLPPRHDPPPFRPPDLGNGFDS